MESRHSLTDLDDHRRRLRDAFSTKLERLTREVGTLTTRMRSSKLPPVSDFAADARNSELGPDMRTIQSAIDKGHFTWDDVFAGRIKGAPIDRALAADPGMAAELRDIGSRAAELYERGGLTGAQAVSAAIEELERDNRERNEHR